ncbi:RES family NAD+ phosphorylase [Mesorhizobium sp. M0522]|uniref:RES family NAD+ phosphorylase n=1 Tax=Mesorhizobium sp. M0522 TaxID=2956958 RepID=UPI00333D6350
MCFLETVLRDRREGILDDLPIEEVELTRRRYAEIATTTDLRLVDLRGDNAVRMGVPTDVVRAQRQNLARRWSVAFHEHPSEPDGIIYPSRLNEATNLAIYDRAVPKLQARRVVTLLGAEGWLRLLRISGWGWCEDLSRIRIAWQRWL